MTRTSNVEGARRAGGGTTGIAARPTALSISDRRQDGNEQEVTHAVVRVPCGGERRGPPIATGDVTTNLNLSVRSTATHCGARLDDEASRSGRVPVPARGHGRGVLVAT